MRSLKFLILLSLFFPLNQLYGQRICASTFNPDEVYLSDNSRYQRYIQLEQYIANYKSSLPNVEQGRLINPNGTIIIPVVVHVIHAAGEAIGIGRNISVAQIQSQIDVLNEDFRRLNPDRINTPNAFVPVASDPNFEFRLACIDPNGNPTDGITRTASTVNAFSGNDDIKFTSRGGHDAWPTNRYLNIWVSNLTGGLLGYAQFPFDYATRPNTDGVVINTTAFGRVGNVTPPFNDGRTATHEIGHWLDLFHIWGDAVCGDDHCDDTPQQHNENYNCPGFPHASNCTNNGANGDMFMNYMDYTDDSCMNIFTNDQRIRMRAIFAQGGPRAAFIENYFSIQPSNPIQCSGTVSLTNLACLSPVNWVVVSGPANIVSGQNTNQITIQATGNGTIQLRATAGNYVSDINVPVTIPNLVVSGPSSICNNQPGYYSINLPTGGSVVWSASPSGKVYLTVLNSNTVQATPFNSPTGSFTLTATVTSSCITTGSVSRNVQHNTTALQLFTSW